MEVHYAPKNYLLPTDAPVIEAEIQQICEITFDPNGGTVDPETMLTGIDLKLSGLPMPGNYRAYTFDGWFTAEGAEVTVDTVFSADTTVYARWPKDTNPFKDVFESDRFYDDVMYVCKEGLMLGVTEDLFAPQRSTTCAMVITVLYRLEGSPAVFGEQVFDDVPAGLWYTDAVAWAAEHGIMSGDPEGTVRPRSEAKRCEVAAILHRFCELLEK